MGTGREGAPLGISAAEMILRMDEAARAEVATRPGYARALRRHFEAWLAPQAESAVILSLIHI